MGTDNVSPLGDLLLNLISFGGLTSNIFKWMVIASNNCALGNVFEPTMSEMAAIFRNWGPMADGASDLNLPISPDCALAPWVETDDVSKRIELSGDHAARFSWVVGVIGPIDERNADNAKTPYRIEIIVKTPPTAVGCGNSDKASYLFTKVRAFGSNAIATSDIAVQIATQRSASWWPRITDLIEIEPRRVAPCGCHGLEDPLPGYHLPRKRNGSFDRSRVLVTGDRALSVFGRGTRGESDHVRKDASALGRPFHFPSRTLRTYQRGRRNGCGG